MKTCIDCKKEKNEDEFYYQLKSKGYKESYCKTCSSARSYRRKKAKMQRDPEFAERIRVSDLKGVARRRMLGVNAAGFFLNDSRKNDQKRGRENDLTREFIETMFERSCSYCGDSEGKKSLDRIDNSIGHLQSNVVTSCVRCNLVRGQMPYEAWLVVAEGMKKAHDLGLFAGWDGNIRRNKVNGNVAEPGLLRCLGKAVDP